MDEPVQILVSEIDEFAENLSEETSDQEVSDFLSNLALTLKNTDRFNMPDDLIPATERLILKMQKVFFAPDRKYHQNVVDTLTEIIGDAQDLGIEMDNSEILRGAFYQKVVQLGFKIEQLSTYLGLLVPVMVSISKAMPLN